MYRSKKDVDKHVESLLSKLSLKEFKSRAYSVARLYFEVGDYDSCQRYVEQYISLKDNNAAAHKLLGQALQKLGQKEHALEQYKTSLDIDANQTSLILDICELLADDEVFIDPGRAQYWCEKAETVFPRHPTTFRLRERLVATANPDPEAIVSLLLAEIAVRPKDVSIHARILRHYMQAKLVKEAFKHSFDVEFSDDNTFLNNNSWYEALSEVLEYYQDNNLSNWQYQLLYLTVKERLCALSLTEIPSGSSRSLVESGNLLHDYDQALEQVANSRADPGCGDFHASLLQHHRGQFSLNSATFLLKKAKKDQLSWRDASTVAAPLMLMAWHAGPLDTKVNWVTQAPEKLQAAVRRWYLEASFRCSQAGHYLLSNVQDRSHSFLDRISQYCSGSHWKDKLYEKLFTNREHLSKIKSSHFVSDSTSTPVLRLPRKSDIETYDLVAQKVAPNSLHHIVWILMNYKNYSNFKCTLFEMLTPKSQNYPNCGPETLNKYDVHAFLYFATMTAQQHKENYRNSFYQTTDKPALVPVVITDLLCSLAQIKWWDCAYKVSQNVLGTELTDIRATLSRGIEVVRCVDSHGLDPYLLCIVGRIFSEASKLTVTEEKNDLATRAVLYYSSALPLLERFKSKLSIKLPDKRMFEYVHKELNNKELSSLIDECKLYVGINYLNENEYEKAIQILSNVKLAQASYHLSQMYYKMALEDDNVYKESLSTADQSKSAMILSKAKKLAYATLKSLKSNQADLKSSMYADTHELIESIGSRLNKFELDASNSNINYGGKSSSDEYASSGSSPRDKNKLHSRANNTRPYWNLSSTPKHLSGTNATYYKSAMESHLFENSRSDHKQLERIESQIKNLQKRDTSMNAFMDQTKEWIEENKNLGSEVRDLKNKLGDQIVSSINANIENTVDQFKLLKLSVDQVKDQIGEYRNECKNDVGDLKNQVAELRKEITKLKSTASEQTIDENDIYNLEDEYRSNDNTPTFASQLPYSATPVIPTFNQRMMPAVAIPPAAYTLYGQNLYNLYNQYSQLAQPSAVPGVSSLFEPARPPLSYPNVYAQPEHLFPDMSHLLPPHIPPVSVPPPQVPSTRAIPAAQNRAQSRSIPGNVVITSSDPVPTSVTVPQPVLSVTIPPEHIKSTPHNYQIPMPSVNESRIMPSTIFSSGILSNSTTSVTTAKPFNVWNESPTTVKPVVQLPTVSIAIGTSVFDSTKLSLFGSPKPEGIFSSLHGDNIRATANLNSNLNKSRTLSEKSNTSVENYDPCPDFKPIIPLPDEVKVLTGEENEVTVFSSRAKLFRFVDKQWKERGLGEIKLLKHQHTGKVRIVMRREQVHKICANHNITPEMEMKPMKNENKAMIWVANDFAEETVILEKFCVRFKTADMALQFYEAFEQARKEADVAIDSAPKIELKTSADNIPTISQNNKTIVGGFTFTNSPTFKVVKDNEKATSVASDSKASKPNPFSGLTFKTNASSSFSNMFASPLLKEVEKVVISNITSEESTDKANTSDTLEDFEPTVDFKPAVPLPALVEQKTGEENELVLFEHRAKLLRFNAATKEWKERGLGNIKLLAHKDNNQKVRLLMRREQVKKVCCNHALTKELVFQKKPNVEQAVTWCAKDFTEGELISETFCIRFKTAQVCDDFLNAIQRAQAKMNDEPKAEEENKAVTLDTKVGFGDKYKPKAGSWCCPSCYTNNLESFSKCACCEQQNPNLVEATQPAKQDNKVSTPTANWGDKFKPKTGTWECKECLIRNEANIDYCKACDSPKDPNMPKKGSKPAIDSKGAPSFSFGIPKISNNTKVESSSIFDGTGSQKFTFGIPAPVPDKILQGIASFRNENVDKQQEPLTNYTFGIGPPKSIIDSKSNAMPALFGVKKPEETSDSVTFMFTPEKSNTTLVLTPPAKQTPAGATASGTFDFVFKPKQISKGKSPIKSPKSVKGEESDEDNAEYEDDGPNIHFSPVVPLPDKVDVVTGEENEVELYSHRAKLFRFLTGEWKERGIGVLKLLRNKDTGKVRVLMRREQVHKICLNHYLIPEITYVPKDEKTWLFTANDFSEGELCLNQFCLRFKNKEIATDFKSAIDKARGDVALPVNADDNDEIVFITEMQATSEEKLKAKELMLPENFYAYKYRKPCPGCRGCEDDDQMRLLDVAVPPITPIGTPKKPQESPSSSIFGTPAVNKTFDASLFRTPLESVGQNSNFTTPSSDPDKTPTNSSSGDKENTYTPRGNIFSGSGDSDFTIQGSVFSTPLQQGTPFGATSLFGGNNTQSNAGKSFPFAAPKLSIAVTAVETKSIFCTTEGTNNNMVGSSNGTDKPVFGTSVSANQSIFGTSDVQNKSLDGSTDKILFGTSSTDSTKSIFGTNDNTNKPLFGLTDTNKSIFGSNDSANKPLFGSMDKSKSIFGTNDHTNKPIFGSTDTNKSVFGSNDSTNKPLFGSTGTNKSIFGSNDDTNKPLFGSTDTNKSIFGSNDSSNKPLFGTTDTNKSIFGSNDSTNKPLFGSTDTSKSIFGNKDNTNMPLFGTTDTNKSIFGSNDSTNKPLFGETGGQETRLGFNTTYSNEKSDKNTVFGTVSDQAKPVGMFPGIGQYGVFGAGSNEPESKQRPGIFSDLTSTESEVSNKGKSILGSLPSENNTWSFNTKTDFVKDEKPTSIFSSFNKDTASSTVDNKTPTKAPADNKVFDTPKTESNVPTAPFTAGTGLSFAALSSSKPDFTAQKNTDFQWEGAGQKLFVAKPTGGDGTTKQQGEEDEGDGAGASEEYDPHYEPIVPLPEKIVVTTGEEDEEKLFNERAKLYRFDDSTHEWKERGVGEIKLLFHPGRNTYRLLLRREQVHKTVLNTLLFKDLELLPMKNTDRAWTWMACNFAEAPAGQQETLALRFKTVNLAVAFQEKIIDSVRKLQAAAAQAIREEKEKEAETFGTIKPLRLPKHLTDSSRTTLTPASTEKPVQLVPAAPEQEGQVRFSEPDPEGGDAQYVDYDVAQHYEYEDYEAYYNEEEEQTSVIYEGSGSVLVQQGDIKNSSEEASVQVLYDAELGVPKILIIDSGTGEILADMMIHDETDFQISGEQCSWSGTDYTCNDPTDKTVTVTFADEKLCHHFLHNCQMSESYPGSSTDPEV